MTRPLLVAAGGIAVIGALVWVFVLAVQSDNRWDDNCRAHGNRVVSHTTMVNTYTNGKPGIGTETTTYCLNSTGGIEDIR